LKRSLFLAIAAIALVVAPRVSSAQLSLVKPFSIGVAGGVTQPMSDLSDAAKLGYNGTAALEIHLERLRLERMLEWIDRWIVGQLHDGSMPCVE
jgi:hypothetical protein